LEEALALIPFLFHSPLFSDVLLWMWRPQICGNPVQPNSQNNTPKFGPGSQRDGNYRAYNIQYLPLPLSTTK